MKKVLIYLLLLMVMISGCKGSVSPNEASQQVQEETISESYENVKTEQFGFRTEELYESHYQKHKSEFGEISKEEYLEQANALIIAQGDNILSKKSEDGDTLFFNTDTNEFLVLSPDEYIRTYFIPDSGISYFERQ